jgi:hypothetical protein
MLVVIAFPPNCCAKIRRFCETTKQTGKKNQNLLYWQIVACRIGLKTVVIGNFVGVNAVFII